MVVIFANHLIACIWLNLGENIDGSWLESGNYMYEDASTKYITSIYWVVTTLTTVGYGDILGKTSEEYAFIMVVEFIGILFFSIMMGSINVILL